MLTLQDVLAARERIRGIVGVTPCPLSEPFSELCGARIHFKLENLHRTGSFKERGAGNKFSLLAPEERKRGVVAASAGNHAQAVAFNAQRLGIQATIVMPETAPLSKVEATRKFGAAIVLPNATTLADGIAVKRAGEKTIPLFRKYVDEIVGVDDEEVANAILALIEREKTVAEGAGAAPAAALLQHKIGGLQPATNVVCAISGGNIDPNLIARIIERGLVVEGRRVMVAVRVPDRPGTLAGVLATVAAERANVLEVHHNRAFLQGAIGDTEIDLTLETRGPAHIEALIDALKGKGYAVVRR